MINLIKKISKPCGISMTLGVASIAGVCLYHHCEVERKMHELDDLNTRYYQVSSDHTGQYSSSLDEVSISTSSFLQDLAGDFRELGIEETSLSMGDSAANDADQAVVFDIELHGNLKSYIELIERIQGYPRSIQIKRVHFYRNPLPGHDDLTLELRLSLFVGHGRSI